MAKKKPTSQAEPKLVVVNDSVGADDTQEEFDVSKLPRIKYSYQYNDNKVIGFYIIEVEKETSKQDNYSDVQLELRDAIYDVILEHADIITKLRARNQESN